ncbi:MAG: cellulase-like family protein [Bacteroidota bacterium]
MNRRIFLSSSVGATPGTVAAVAGCGPLADQDSGLQSATEEYSIKRTTGKPYPLAITMWEFSWLERRWPGAGYEDWDRALSELVDRGYDAIRIDAFPHLIDHEPEKEYLLLPHWSVQDWGSPAINRVQVQPKLNRFLEKCREYGVRVGLSSWFRKDEDDLRMKLDTPEKLGKAWLSVLKSIDEGGVLDTIFYVDLCNEWTGDAWCPFFKNDPPEALWTGWDTEKSRKWMKQSIALLKEHYPDIPYTFSFTGEVSKETLSRGSFEMLDFLEPHIWMTSFNNGAFYNEVGYTFDRFNYDSYRNLALHGERIYRERKVYWQEGLRKQIGYAARWSELSGQPLVTTECWGVVDFKDLPLLEWDYVKELCALGTLEAAGTGRWLAIATSNFCGPQFVGMWRDKEWHRRLTSVIHKAPVAKDLLGSPLARRLELI